MLHRRSWGAQTQHGLKVLYEQVQPKIIKYLTVTIFSFSAIAENNSAKTALVFEEMPIYLNIKII
jgi:hypothetical protein